MSSNKCGKTKSAVTAKGDYKKGKTHFNAREFKAAYKCFNIGAAVGHVPSIHFLGLIAYGGLCGPKSYISAAHYFQIGANAEYTYSQASLATLYMNGRGVHYDPSKALSLFKASLKHGRSEVNRVTLWRIGGIYKRGDGVDQAYDTAMKYFNMSMLDGYPAAAFSIGDLYLRGMGVTVDYEAASRYFAVAARGGHAEAQFKLGLMFIRGVGENVDVRRGFKLMRMAACNGESRAFLQTGLMYKNGQGVERNDEEAFRWFRKSARKRYSVGMYHLATMHHTGRGTPMDLQKASYYYSLSEQLGYSPSKLMLAALSMLDLNTE
tara:strand:- start:3564 stop:4526 length:963 start_codon:yes stop_codon:yes gene_type:complete